jgi:hypothetical protein
MAQSPVPTAALSFGFLPVVTKKLKLTKGNYVMWHAQVLSALKGAQLALFLEPTTELVEFLEVALSREKAVEGKKIDPLLNPEYEKWVARLTGS